MHGGKCDAFAPYSVYLGLSKYLSKRYQNEKALAYYQFLLDQAKTRKRCATVLHNRAVINAQLGNIPSAREDIDQAIVHDPLSMDIHYANAYILLQENKFEDALVEFHRGYQQRKQPDYFLQGILRATGTIEDSIGYNAGQWSDQEVLGKTLLNMKLEELNLSPPPKEMSDVEKNRQAVLLEKKKNHFSRKFLGRLSAEKEFFNKILYDPVLNANSDATIRKLKEIATTGLRRLNAKEETFWKRKPIYAIDFQSPHPSAKLREEYRQQQAMKQQAVEQYIIRALYKVYEAMLGKQWTECYKLGERLKLYLDARTKKLVPEKRSYLKTLYFVLGEMYLSMKCKIPSWDRTKNDRRIQFMLSVPGDYGVFVNVFRESVHAYIPDPGKFAKKLRGNLKLSDDPLERAFLFHELSCCLALQRQPEDMQACARECVLESKRAGNIVWFINGAFLLARAGILMANLMDTKVSLTAAREAAVEFQFTYVAEFADRALALVNRENEQELLVWKYAPRESETIMGMMANDDLRYRADKIIRRINSRPANERLPLSLGMLPSFDKSAKEEELELNEQDAAEKIREIKENLSRRQTLIIKDDFFDLSY